MRRWVSALTAAAVVSAAACSTTSDGPVALEIWFDQTTGPARDVLAEQVRLLNEATDEYTVLLRVLPAADYVQQVTAARTGGGLPELMWVDDEVLDALGDGLAEVIVPADVIVEVDSLTAPLRAAAAALSVDDRLVALPVAVEPVVAFLHAPSVARAGRADDLADTTWTTPRLAGVVALLEAGRVDGPRSPVVSLPADPADLSLVVAGLSAASVGPAGVGLPGDDDVVTAGLGVTTGWLADGVAALAADVTPDAVTPVVLATTRTAGMVEDPDVVMVTLTGLRGPAVGRVGGWAVVADPARTDHEVGAIADLLAALVAPDAVATLADAASLVPATRDAVAVSVRSSASGPLGATASTVIRHGVLVRVEPFRHLQLVAPLLAEVLAGTSLATAIDHALAAVG